MSEEIARIIHVSDFHLFVDTDGNDREARLKSAVVKLALIYAQRGWKGEKLRALAAGIQTHSRQTLDAFLTTLRELLAVPHACKLILIQTGDVEAFGVLGGSEEFHGFAYWATVRDQLERVERSIDIYGNHDVWPGTLPAAKPLRANNVELALLRRPEFRDLLPDRVVVPTVSCPVEFYRLNTVRSGFVSNTFARGRIRADRRIGNRTPYPQTRGMDPLDELIALAGEPGEPQSPMPPVRILVMHHPPHFFHASAGWEDLAQGPLDHVDELVRVLTARRFHLVLAGHRHRVDPSPGVRLTPAKHGAPQHPLLNTTVQLVAGTTTQMVSDPADERPSFSVYTPKVQRGSMTVDVERTVYRHLNPTYDRFQPGDAEVVALGLPLG